MVEQNIILGLLIIFGLAIILFVLVNMRKNNAKLIEMSFVNIANKILEEKTNSLSQKNLKDLNLTLEPFKEQIKDLKEQIQNQQKEQSAAKESFKNQVDQLLKATDNMNDNTQNLTNALKGDSKTQGLWGEQILERTLEESGLEKGLNYELQKGFRASDGSLKIPDAVIYLPGERNIVIDSKVSLTAYEKFIKEDDAKLKEVYLKDHIVSLKKNMKSLKEQDYHTLPEINSPDYVLMFVPIESALSLALTNDWELQKYANDNRMAFVTPTNLIAILRIAENLWRLDKHNKHADLIAERAGHLIDKFSGLTEDLEDVGRHLKSVEKSFLGAQNKLYEGQGNLFNQMKDLEKLGAKNKKNLKQPKKNLLEE